MTWWQQRGRAPIFAKLALTESGNTKPPWPIRRVVGPGQTLELTRI